MIKITLDRLNEDHVVVETKNIDGNGYVQEHRKGYDNSKYGRQQVENEVAEPYRTIIFMLWGDNPTINEEDI